MTSKTRQARTRGLRRRSGPSGMDKMLRALSSKRPGTAKRKRTSPGRKPVGGGLALVGLAGLAVKNRDRLPGRGRHSGDQQHQGGMAA
jgi:hypothetical protein